MKQKLLNNFKLRATLLVAMLCAAFTGAWGQETITFADLNLVNGTQYSDPFDGGEFTVTFAGGGNDGKYYNTGSGIRVYGNGTMTIASENTIESITITYDGSYKPTDGTVVNVGTYDADNGEWTGSATEIVFTRPSGSGHWRVQSVSVTYATGGSQTETCAAPSFDPATGTTFGNGGLSVSISTDTDGATIYYTLDGSAPTTNSAQYSGAIQLTTTTTIKAIAVKDGMNNSSTATATYTYIDPNANDGSAEHPYTVAEARAAIDAGTGVTGVYATGIVSEIVTPYNSGYGNISYNISADGSTTSDQLQAYRGFSYNGDKFTSADDIQVGATVVIYGNLTKYGNTYEFAANNQLVSYTAPVVAVEAPTFSPAAGTYASAQNVTISCETSGVTIYYTTDGTEPTNQSTEYTGSIAVEGNTTIKAIAYDVTGANSTVATATYHICSAVNPYTVTQALAFSEYPANGVYVSGIVSTAPTQSPTNNGQLTYYISVDGNATDQLQVYKGLGLDQAAFTAQDDIQVGDEVTIYGNVKIYNNTKEFDTGNYLVAFNRPEAPKIIASTTSLIEFTYVADNGPSAAQQLTIGGENLTNSWSAHLDDYGNSNFEFSFTEEGEYYSESGIGSMEVPNQNQYVTIYVRLKSGLAAGDYPGGITITSQGAETVTVSLYGSVTETLEAPVWSELPAETISVGEDYVLNLADFVSGSPVPEILLETGTNIAQFEDNIFSFTPTEAGSFDFTFSASNSVGSAEATLTITVIAPASIEVSETAINVPATTTTGWETINVTYNNITDQPAYFAHEQFYDADDNQLTANPASDWITVGMMSDNNISYQIKSENTSSEPRTVYFRIWAPDDNDVMISSELITITQAGVAAPVTEESYQLYTGALTEGDYIIYYGEKAMNTEVTNDRLQYAEVTPQNDVITTDDASIVWHIAQSGDYWTIYNVDADAYAAGTGAKNKAQMLDDGTDDKALWTVSGTETYEFVNKANAAASVNANLRNNGTYGFACYATNTGGALTLYKKATNTNTPSITITPDSYEMDAKAGGGELPVVCANLATDPQLEVVFVEADGVTPATYDWISAEINNNGNIDGQITANTGDARTAYFYVQGVDADNNVVKSNLVTFTQQAAATEPYIMVNTTEWNVDANGGSKTFGFDYENLGDSPTFEVAFFDQTGETEIGCGWISYEFVGDKVTITASNNDENSARTAYFKVYAEVNKTAIYSNLVTINQAAPVVDYAELPFYWGGGASANLAALNGVTLYGNGSDYAANHAPYLVKLDSDSDYILVKTDSRPGVVTVGVKMIGGATASTITVQESTDGETFTDVQELSISGKQNDILTLTTTNPFAENSRYVRLLFTKGSNVGVGPISISKASTEPSITITPDTYEMDAKAGGGELPVVCANLATDPQLAVVFVEADGETPATYDWITAEINNNGNIDGQILANETGEARTAYFVVRGVDADNNYVYSNLVTFTQEAAPTEPFITVNTGSWDFDVNGGSKTFGFDFANLGESPTFEVAFFDQTGETEIGCGWISYEFVGDKVTISAMTNDEGAARTAYFKVHAIGTEIYSNLVTVNQAAPVVDYATLPFSWDDTNTPNGITTSGVGTYKSSPYMKFDGSGDYIILKIDEVPGTLTFDVKGNTFSGGTFTVQTSADGVDYDDLETYTELDATQSETFKLASSVRYIKWVYTEKVTGNVALGNIVVTAPMNLNLNAYGYATYASEYALDFTTAKAEGYSAWEITEVNYSTGTITFNQIKDKVAAGTGVLLMGDPSSEVTLTRTANGEALPDNKLVGITESKQVGDNQYFGLKGNEFVKVNTGVVPAGKALLPIDNLTAGVKSFTLIFNDADGIQTIETVSAEKAQAIFNLAGQRLPKAQKGINIINGKKVLVK